MSSLATPLPLVLKPGLKLVPLYTGRVGNAIITEATDGYYTVVTDFGNELRLAENELRGMFEATYTQFEYEVMYEQVMGEPIDVHKELVERFERQLELISKQLNKLKKPTAA